MTLFFIEFGFRDVVGGGYPRVAVGVFQLVGDVGFAERRRDLQLRIPIVAGGGFHGRWIGLHPLGLPLLSLLLLLFHVVAAVGGLGLLRRSGHRRHCEERAVVGRRDDGDRLG